MDQSPFQLVRERLEERGYKIQGTGRHFAAQCPAHEDRSPSLSVTDGTTRVLLRCFAGCESEDVLAALGLTWKDLRADEEQAQRSDPIVAAYDYVDEASRPLFQVTRTASKKFRQRVHDPAVAGGWRWELTGVRRVLYRLPQVIKGVTAGKTIVIAEGEKDVHALEEAGAVATCNPGGAGKWRPEYSLFFKDARVTIVQDNDDPGRAHAAAVARSLDAAGAAEVQIVEPRTGKDAYDHLHAGWKIEDFRLYRPGLAPDLHEFLAQEDPGYQWVIERVLERGDRLIITGPEGKGKSLLTRQLAVCAAAGLHPFTGKFTGKHNVLFVDCENSERTSRRAFRRLAQVTDISQRRVPDGGLRIIHRPEGLNLAGEDAAWLLEQVANHKPDMLVIGPLYRLHVVDANEETAARAIVNALDAARLTVNCALVIEAHSPHGETGRLSRPLRPAGSSLFMRWPEFGFGLRPRGSETDWDAEHVARVEQWRGPREERELPRYLMWGDMDFQLPWIEPPPAVQNPD